MFSFDETFASESVLKADSIDVDKVQSLINASPIKHLNSDAQTRRKLTDLGLNTVGDVKQLPSHALGRRQSHFFMDYLSRLYGLKADLRKAYITPPSFFEESYSLQSVSNLHEILPAFELQLAKLQRFLRQYQLHCIELRWLLKNDFGYRHRLYVGVESCHNNTQSMLKLTQLKGEKQPIKRAINHVSLQSVHRPLSQQLADDLFPESLSKPLDQQLVETLEARLGRDRVGYIQSVGSHRPEQLASHANTSTGVEKRPTWLFKSPKLIQSREKTLTFEGQRLDLLQGPERIDTQWWNNRCQRDYYIAKNTQGLRYWVYHDLANKRWFVQGVFG